MTAIFPGGGTLPSSVVTDSRAGGAIPIDSTGAVTGNTLIFDSVEGVWEPGAAGGGSTSEQALGNLGATPTVTLTAPVSIITGTLNANCAMTIAGLTAGCSGVLLLVQDATGGRTLTIGGAAVSIPTAANAFASVQFWSEDGANLWVLPGPQIGGGGGGGGAGSPIVRKFPFAYNTPDLLTGAAIYTPTIGDILLDAWVQINTPWDGTTPLFDVGSFVENNSGWFCDGVEAVDMTEADQATNGLGVICGTGTNSLRDSSTIYSAPFLINVRGAGPTLEPIANSGQGERLIPAYFAAANPIMVCVSQDGTNTGADPGSTQGAAVLYLVTATPV